MNGSANAEVDDLMVMYTKMAQKMKGKQSMVEDLLQNIDLPFTDRVIEFPLPEIFIVLLIKMYDGTQDPAEHLETYRMVIGYRN